MPRFYFDLHDTDGPQQDKTGEECPDEAAAEKSAIDSLAMIAADHPISSYERLSMVVRNETGVLFSVRLKLEVTR